MCWMDNGGKSCLKEFDLASILWPSVEKKNTKSSALAFPEPTLLSSVSTAEDERHIFQSFIHVCCVLEAIRVFTGLLSQHYLLGTLFYISLNSLGLSATMSFQEERVAVICPRLSPFICHHCLLCRHSLPTEIREQKLWGPAGLVSGLWQIRVCW